jgi:hypothetical protein
MNEFDRRRQQLTFQLGFVIALLAIATPTAGLYVLERASIRATDTGQSLDLTSFNAAWPVYAIMTIGLLWTLGIASTWLVVNEEERHTRASSTGAHV